MQGSLNLYLVRAPHTVDYLGYDTYSEFVCSADSSESARFTHPDGGPISKDDQRPWSWVKYEDLHLLEVTLIGVASANITEPSVIVSSYHAG